MFRNMHDDAAAPSRQRAAGARRRSRGMASVLAMMFLVIFAALALGFYATTNVATSTAYNDQRSSVAQAAAESGLAFARYHLSALDITQTLTPAQQFEEVFMQLEARLNGTNNLQGSHVDLVYDDPNYPDGKIVIPASGIIPTGSNGAGFRVIISPSGPKLIVKAVGAMGTAMVAARGVESDFAVAQNASSIFNYGVASRGAINLIGNSRITGVPKSLGNLLTTTYNTPALTMDSNAAISGNVSFLNPAATYTMNSNATIADQSTPAEVAKHIETLTVEPEFPVIDTRAFEPYATNVLSVVGKKYDSATPLRNIRVKASTNPIFDSNQVIEGVVYIEQPNKVTFNSNVVIKGVVVVDNKVVGTSATNSITFSSNVKVTGMGGLPAPTANPALDPFPAGLRALTGSTILAPNFNLHMNSNFGAAGGAVVAGKMVFDSNAVGTINGSVIALEASPLEMRSNSAIVIESLGTTQYPAGVYFGYHYAPLLDTYREVRPY